MRYYVLEVTVFDRLSSNLEPVCNSIDKFAGQNESKNIYLQNFPRRNIWKKIILIYKTQHIGIGMVKTHIHRYKLNNGKFFNNYWTCCPWICGYKLETSSPLSFLAPCLRIQIRVDCIRVILARSHSSGCWFILRWY